MILTWIYNAAYYWLGVILDRLPVGTLPDDLISSLTYFWSALNAFSYIFPVGTFLAVMLIVWILDHTELGFRIILWLYSKIPFIGK